MLARLFVIFGGLFVLVLCAALVVPYFIDWTGYRGDFEREAIMSSFSRPERIRSALTALARIPSAP